MATINVYEQYFEAELTFNEIKRRAAKVMLIAESECGNIRYEAAVTFFPHTDEEDYAAELAKCRSVLRCVSIRVPDMAWYEALFTEVFGMHTEQKQLTANDRRTVFVEGIVLVYAPGMEETAENGALEKICLDVDDAAWTIQEALRKGCAAAEDPQEVRLPNGILLRVQDMEA